MKLIATSSRKTKNGTFCYVLTDGTPEQYRDYAAKTEANALKNGSDYKVKFDAVTGTPLHYSETLYYADAELVLNYDGTSYIVIDPVIEEENLEREATIQQMVRAGLTREDAQKQLSQSIADQAVQRMSATTTKRTFNLVRRTSAPVTGTPAGTPSNQDNTNLHDLLAPEGKKK